MSSQPRHDTPVDVPEVDAERATPSKRQIEQRQEWETAAVQFHIDGYSSSVVALKLIQVYQMPNDAAAELVGRVFGKKVEGRVRDAAHAVTVGIAMALVAIAGVVLVFTWLGFGDRLTTVLYLGLFAFAGKGVSDAIAASMKGRAKRDPRK